MSKCNTGVHIRVAGSRRHPSNRDGLRRQYARYFELAIAGPNNIVTGKLNRDDGDVVDTKTLG